jgi:hypothetical protein
MRIRSSRQVQNRFTVRRLAFRIDDIGETRMRWPGITMFLLFFGIATLDAVTSRNWLRIAFWLAMGVSFAFLDWWGGRRGAKPPSSY